MTSFGKLLVSGILLVLAGAAYAYMVWGPKPVAVMLDPVLYPLYPSVQWGSAHTATTTDGAGVGIESVPIKDTNDIAAVTAPFTKYYDDKLAQAGWTRDMSREAGGPGAEVSYYTKGQQFAIVSFHSDFKVRPADAPAQCPCDVTLSLMSGTQEGPTPGEVQATHEYHDTVLGFSVTLPTALASSTNDALWSVDPAYQYQAKGPSKEIPGVKFTIPSSLAAGTNLAQDTYVSVEHLASSTPAGSCDAAAFLADPNAKSRIVKEGFLAYSVASSTDAAVGNRYEETVYARAGTNPCIAVRYFVHYAAIENFPEGSVHAFDRDALFATFDQVRRSVRLRQ